MLVSAGVVTYCTGAAVGAVVARCVQAGVTAAPGGIAFGAVAEALAPLDLVPSGRVPLPAGDPPPAPPGWLGVCPPVRTVELTCTIACRNGGTASATLVMNARPASAPIARSQAIPADLPCLAPTRA